MDAISTYYTPAERRHRPERPPLSRFFLDQVSRTAAICATVAVDDRAAHVAHSYLSFGGRLFPPKARSAADRCPLGLVRPWQSEGRRAPPQQGRLPFSGQSPVLTKSLENTSGPAIAVVILASATHFQVYAQFALVVQNCRSTVTKSVTWWAFSRLLNRQLLSSDISSSQRGYSVMRWTHGM